MQASGDIRVLGVQLDSKLRWQPHMKLLQAKLMTRTAAVQSITGSTWGMTMHAARRVYVSVSRPAITHGALVWYTPWGLRGHRKGDVTKLKSIQGQFLRAATGAYRATPTEALEVETNVMPLDIHIEKLLAKATIRLHARSNYEVVSSATRRIKEDIKGKRGRRAQLRRTPGEERKLWVDRMVTSGETGEGDQGETRGASLGPYVTAPWTTALQVFIDTNDETARRTHDACERSQGRTIYLDGSGREGVVTAAAVDLYGWKAIEKLGGPGIALTHHGELEGLTRAAEELAKRCATSDKSQGGLTYTVFSDSQASLKTVLGLRSEWDQARIRRLLAARDTIEARGAGLSLRWIPGYKGILGNEEADRAASDAQDLRRSHGTVEEPTAKVARVYEVLRAKWKRRWIEGTKGRELFTIASEVSNKYISLYRNRAKAHCSLLIQLRTGKIGFNQFLTERGVPGFLTGRCECGNRSMTVKHVVLSCPRWEEERRVVFSRAGSTDLREILNNSAGITATIRMILATNLLRQFQITLPPREEERGEVH